MNDTNETRSLVARVQHEIWAHWMEYLFSISEENEDGSVTIKKEKAEQWKRQIETSYNDLSDSEKRSDLDQADKVLEAIA